MSKPRLNFQSVLIGFATLLIAASPVLADSNARVVRLSEVQGKVEMIREASQGYERAFMNLPITQGVKIRTGPDGRAEMEFEDSSTLRLTPGSEIEVAQLLLRDSGAKVSSIHMLEGIAYVNFRGAKDDEFTMTFAREHLALTQAAHLRMGLGDAEAAVAVFSGYVQVTGPSGTVNIAKNQTARFDLADDSYKLAKNIQEDPFDAWDKQQSQYQERYADNTYGNYSPYAYGTTDMNYYGSWYNLAGYGPMWQPYFAGAGWDPFSNGAWTLFPGFGYGWVSAYPWGWIPYNYGAWNYIPLYGWMWAPGGTWFGGYGFPGYLNSPFAFEGTRMPLLAGRRVIAVNRASSSRVSDGLFSHIQIPGNSAGLGIPRGSVPNLSVISELAEVNGSVTTRVRMPVFGSSSWWRVGAPQSARWGSSRAGGWSGSTSSSHSSGGGHAGGGSGGHH